MDNNLRRGRAQTFFSHFILPPQSWPPPPPSPPFFSFFFSQTNLLVSYINSQQRNYQISKSSFKLTAFEKLQLRYPYNSYRKSYIVSPHLIYLPHMPTSHPLAEPIPLLRSKRLGSLIFALPPHRRRRRRRFLLLPIRL